MPSSRAASKVPRKAGIAAVTLALAETDGYTIDAIERRGDTAVITLRRTERTRGTMRRI